jgi:ribonuclease BN (tRNA processing enzyme)
MYQLIFIGTGNAFYDKKDNYQSNVIIIAPNGNKLLIDCGGDARRALNELNFTYQDITNLFISHLHADHIGGLEWLALARYFDPATENANLYCPDTIVESLWDNCLKGGLSCIDSTPSLSSFFHVKPCPDKETFAWEGLKMTPVFAYHCPDGGDHMPCYSLLIESDNTTIFFTADSKFTPEYHRPFFQKADIIFHDCETAEVATGVHAHYNELKTLPIEIKKKMHLYHCKVRNPSDPSADGFFGYVNRGEVYTI